MTPRSRIGILASGAGSNMEAIARACTSGQVDADIALVIANREGAGVLTRAQELDIPALCIPHSAYGTRDAFDEALLVALRAAGVDWVVLAGFMRILTAGFIREYYGCLLNIHPSLLPKYPGLHTHRRAIEAGDTHAGATVHFVIPELDAGPPIIQARVPILPGDDAERLALRVQSEEHRIYPLALQWCLSGRVALQNGQTVKDGLALDNDRILT